jgi:hypothetical protein
VAEAALAGVHRREREKETWPARVLSAAASGYLKTTEGGGGR